MLEVGNAFVVDCLGGRQGQRFYFLPRRALNGTEHASLTGRDKEYCVALSTGTSGSPDSVDVGFRVVGNVVVDYVADAVHIQATCRNVCGDQNIQAACLELVDHLLSLLLRHIAIHCGGGVTSGF